MQVKLRVAVPGSAPRVLSIEAASETAALQNAASLGLQVLAIESVSAAMSADRGSKRSALDVLLFSQQLLALLEAGLNVTEALETLHAKERQAGARTTLAGILQALREGRNLSDTLAVFPTLFSDVYVATVRASERTGDLPAALARYIGYQLQFDAIRKKLVSASIYPLMLLAVGFLVLLFLLGYVVPKFSAVYDTAGRELPAMSVLLVALGKAIHAHWSVVLASGVGCAIVLALLIMQPRVRRNLVEKLLTLPYVAPKAAEFRLARFYRAVSLLLAAGTPLIRALQMVDGLLADEQRGRLASARREIESGLPLSTALVAQGLAGPVAESLLRVGEDAGRLTDMLERSAAFHDDDFARWIDWASRLIEPLLMTAIGLVIGAVVVLMYIPIFELAGSLQ